MDAATIERVISKPEVALCRTHMLELPVPETSWFRAGRSRRIRAYEDVLVEVRDDAVWLSREQVDEDWNGFRDLLFVIWKHPSSGDQLFESFAYDCWAPLDGYRIPWMIRGRDDCVFVKLRIEDERVLANVETDWII